MLITWNILVAFVLLGTTFIACSDAKNEIDSQIKCPQICNKYSDCFDSDYDTDKCSSKCEAKYDDDPSYIKKIDACNSCIDDKSCSESTFKCADECLGIVP